VKAFLVFLLSLSSINDGLTLTIYTAMRLATSLLSLALEQFALRTCPKVVIVFFLLLARITGSGKVLLFTGYRSGKKQYYSDNG